MQVTIGTGVTFAEGMDRFAGTVTGIRDEFHVNMTLADGRKLVNCPPCFKARHVGWYALRPSEVLTIVNATTFNAVYGGL